VRLVPWPCHIEVVQYFVLTPRLALLALTATSQALSTGTGLVSLLISCFRLLSISCGSLFTVNSVRLSSSSDVTVASHTLHSVSILDGSNSA
jgi:hypothetical protein